MTVKQKKLIYDTIESYCQTLIKFPLSDYKHTNYFSVETPNHPIGTVETLNLITTTTALVYLTDEKRYDIAILEFFNQYKLLSEFDIKSEYFSPCIKNGFNNELLHKFTDIAMSNEFAVYHYLDKIISNIKVCGDELFFYSLKDDMTYRQLNRKTQFTLFYRIFEQEKEIPKSELISIINEYENRMIKLYRDKINDKVFYRHGRKYNIQ